MAAEQILVIQRITDGEAPTATARLATYGKTYGKLCDAGSERADISFRGAPTQWRPRLERPYIETMRKISKAHEE